MNVSLSRSEKENCASNEKEQINISESPSSLQHIEPERDPLSKENSDSVDNNNEKATGTTLSTGCSTTSPCLMDSIDITSNVHDNITVNDNSNEASPAIMSGAEKNDIWSEDIFGMRIQRVDSVESLDGRNEVDKLDCRDLSVDQVVFFANIDMTLIFVSPRPAMRQNLFLNMILGPIRYVMYVNANLRLIKTHYCSFTIQVLQSSHSRIHFTFPTIRKMSGDTVISHIQLVLTMLCKMGGMKLTVRIYQALM